MGTHHGNEIDPKMAERLLNATKESSNWGNSALTDKTRDGILDLESKKKLEEEEAKSLGSTGSYPEGKLQEDDKGEIRFSVGLVKDEKKVAVNFGKSVRWIAMNRNQALSFGRAVIQTAKQIKE